MVESVHRLSGRRVRWQRWSGPVTCWLRNRWHWRTARRMRADIQRWETRAVPLERIPPHDDPVVQGVAEIAESLGYSLVLQYGYGMGEAVLEAYRDEPKRLRPLIDRVAGFTAEQLSGAPGVEDGDNAVRVRNELLLTVRDVIARRVERDDVS